MRLTRSASRSASADLGISDQCSCLLPARKSALLLSLLNTELVSGHSIGNQPMHPFVPVLRRVGLQIFRFGGKADNKPGTVAMPRQRGQNVDSTSRKRTAPLFFSLPAGWLLPGLTRQVGDCSSTDCDVSRQPPTGGQHVTRRFHRNVGDICWRCWSTGPLTRVTLVPRAANAAAMACPAAG